MSDWSTRLESLLRFPSGQPAEQTIKAIVDLSLPTGREPDELPGCSHPASQVMGRQAAVSQSRWPKFQGFRHKYKAES
jgi:hypothetical protein